MSAKIFLAGDSLIFNPYYNYDPRTTIVALRQEGPSIQKAFRDHEMIVRGRTPKVNTVVEEATVVETAAVSQPVIEAIPAEQPIAVPTTPPPSTTTAEVPKRKLTLKLKETAATPVQRAKPKLVLKTQPSQ